MKIGQLHNEDTKRRMSISAKKSQTTPEALKRKSAAAHRRWSNYKLLVEQGVPSNIALKAKTSPPPKNEPKENPLDELCEFWFTKLGPLEL